MPRKNLPPFVQTVWRDRAKKLARGYRGWALFGDRRKFGPTRRTADEAHRDAMRMRALLEEPSWGGSIETRANEWLAAISHRVSADTIEFYKTKLSTIYRTIPRTIPVDRITPAVVREFVREATDKGLSARTVQHCRRTLSGLFGWMVRRGFVKQSPLHDVEWPKPAETQPDVLNEVELAGCLARISDPWAAALSVFLAYTGLRRAEMARLQTADVDLVSGVLWVRGKARAQSHPVPLDARGAARTLIEAGGEFIVPGKSEKGRREKIAETFRTWQRKLGEKRWHPHALRHSVATIMLRRGASAPVVQRFLRHASYAMTQRYVHMVEDDLRDATTRLRLLGGDGAHDEGAG